MTAIWEVWARTPGYNPAMSLIINYIADLAPWIYGLCGLSALVYLYRVRNIRTERLQAIFALERERAAQAMTGIVTGVVGLLLVMGLTYMTSNLATVIEAEAGSDLPVEVGNEPTSGSVQGTDTSLSPADETTGAGQAAPQPDLRNVPFCEDESALLSSPAVDDELAGTVAIQGTAAHEELFASYDISIAPGSDPVDQDFTSLGRAYNNVRGGLLWEFDTSNIGLSGPYTLRLSVLDADDAVLADCSVAVRIVN